MLHGHKAIQVFKLKIKSQDDIEANGETEKHEQSERNPLSKRKISRRVHIKRIAKQFHSCLVRLIFTRGLERVNNQTFYRGVDFDWEQDTKWEKSPKAEIHDRLIK